MPRTEEEIQADLAEIRRAYDAGELTAAQVVEKVEAVKGERGAAVPTLPVLPERFFERLGVAVDAGVAAFRGWKSEG